MLTMRKAGKKAQGSLSWERKPGLCAIGPNFWICLCRGGGDNANNVECVSGDRRRHKAVWGRKPGTPPSAAGHRSRRSLEDLFIYHEFVEIGISQSEVMRSPNKKTIGETKHKERNRFECLISGIISLGFTPEELMGWNVIDLWCSYVMVHLCYATALSI